MKKGIAIVGIVIVALIGGISMGCIGTAPVDVIEPDNGGLTEKGLQVKADVAERQARGFVQYTGATELVVVAVVGIELVVVEYVPVLTYSDVSIEYPENLAGYDTIAQRAAIYEQALIEQLEAMDTLTVSQYLPPSTTAYDEFYTAFWQDKLDNYAKMYNMVGNKILTDEDVPCSGEEYVGTVNITYNNNTYEITSATFTWDCQNNITLSNKHVLATATVIEHNETSAVLIDIEVYVCSQLVAEIDGPVIVDF
jgi:hypothetical protein